MALRLFRVALVLLTMVLGAGCHDLGKATTTWSRTDDVRMTPDELRFAVCDAFRAAGFGSAGHEGNPYHSETSRVARDSGAYRWRRAVWMVAGFPTELTCSVVAAAVFAIPTAGASSLALVLPFWDVEGRLARNSLSVSYEVSALPNGLARGICTVKGVGASSEANMAKARLWPQLEARLAAHTVR